MAWLDLTDQFTKKGIKKLKSLDRTHGLPVLGFDYEGTLRHYRITRFDERTGKVWAKETELIKPEQLRKVENDKSTNT